MMQLTLEPTLNCKQEKAYETPISTGSGSSKTNVDVKRSPAPANTGGTNFMKTTSVEQHTLQYCM